MKGWIVVSFVFLVGNLASGTEINTLQDSNEDINDIVCLHEGHFPDNDCSKYFVCYNHTATAFKCEVEGQHYNASSKACESNIPCGTFDCSKNETGVVAHTVFTRYYTFCPRPEEPFVVDACPSGYVMNTTSQACEPICQQEEVVPDINDCHYFFKCTFGDDSRLIKERYKCPDGQAYSKATLLCADESQVDSCKYNIPIVKIDSSSS